MKQTAFARIPFHPARFPFFYGWWILVVGTVGVLLSAPGQTIGVSTFTDSLIEVLGMTRDQLSWAYMLGTISSSLLLTKMGRLYDRYGVRPTAMVASVTLACGLLYLSQVDRIATWLQTQIGATGIIVPFVVVLLGFLAIRLSGQGVLTLAGKSMMMKWFDERRGFALGFSNFFIAIGFSFAPLFFETLIQSYDWRWAWQIMAGILLFLFPIFVFVFYRNDPTDVGLIADGHRISKRKDKPKRFPVHQSLSLNKARFSFTFWVFAVMLAMNGLYKTAFAFNIVSIFAEFGGTRSEAVSIFPYIAITAGICTLILSPISDLIKMKYFLLLMGLAGLIATTGFIYLGSSPLALWALIVGNGLTTSLYGIIGAVVWMRYYGKTHLGAILGQVMMLTVLFSAVGPILFSKSLTLFGSYDGAGWVCFSIFGILLLCGYWVRNPQEDLKGEVDAV